MTYVSATADETPSVSMASLPGPFSRIIPDWQTWSNSVAGLAYYVCGNGVRYGIKNRPTPRLDHRHGATDLYLSRYCRASLLALPSQPTHGNALLLDAGQPGRARAEPGTGRFCLDRLLHLVVSAGRVVEQPAMGRDRRSWLERLSVQQSTGSARHLHFCVKSFRTPSRLRQLLARLPCMSRESISLRDVWRMLTAQSPYSCTG